MVVNIIDPLMPMNSIQHCTKLKVNIILFTYTHHFSIIHIVLVPFKFCNSFFDLKTVRRFENNSGYFYCTGFDKGIQQLCSPGTEVTFQDGGCVNITSE
jgi:hypothetical protein